MKDARYKYDEKLKKEVVERYIAGERIKDLCKEFGFNYTTGYKWLEQAGVSLRCKEHAHRGKRKRKKVCPKCGFVSKHAEALFCCMCGAVIKSDEELLVEALEELTGVVQFLPDRQRDKAVETINKAISCIEKAEGKTKGGR